VHAFSRGRLSPAAVGAAWSHGQLKSLEGYIAGKACFALDRLILADIALAPVVKRCLEFQIEHPELPEITRWMKATEVPR
jgi:glutathione S-transferase